jgi:uncharacterized damage-inducible protein DinB
MSEVRRINGQLRRAFDGEAWHGPAVREILAGVTARQAAAHPIPNAHSIWEIALHIAAWEAVVRRRVEGEAIGGVSDEENFPPVTDTSEESCQAMQERLYQGHEALRDTLRNLGEERLEEIAPGTNYSIYFMLHGVVQHDLYHAGQIALLKKAVGQ